MIFIGLVAKGNVLTWYVNQQQAGNLTNSTYQKGGISLLASPYTGHTGETKVSYTDCAVWQVVTATPRNLTRRAKGLQCQDSGALADLSQTLLII